jgi:phosphomannomutase
MDEQHVTPAKQLTAEPIISVSGLRGVIGESLDADVAARFVAAYLTTLPEGPIVVTRDGRASGPMLAAAIEATLVRYGRRCLQADVAATPTTGVLVRERHAAGGIQISASHNPPQYNGIKLFSSAGQVISAAEGQRVIAQYRAGAAPMAPAAPGVVERVADPHAKHLELVLATVNVPRIRERRFKVLLDANHGAGAALGKRLLETLGCDATLLGAMPDGQFEHLPEPIAENLAGVLQHVTEIGAEIGFCQDPDADRLAIIDSAGRYLGEEYTLALCVDHWLQKQPGAVVTNCSTSRMTEDLAKRYGVPAFRSPVGEANVTAAMQARHAVLGGEGSGGVIHPQVGYVRDSFVGMALVLDMLAARGKPIGELADALPHYAMAKTKMTLSADKLPDAFAALRERFADARADLMDGLRLDLPDKWLLVRGSNTEPIVRAIAEAPTVAEAKELCDVALKVLATV